MKFEADKIAAKKERFDKDWLYFDLSGKEIKKIHIQRYYT